MERAVSFIFSQPVPKLSASSEQLISTLYMALTSAEPERAERLRGAILDWARTHPNPRSTILRELLRAIHAGACAARE